MKKEHIILPADPNDAEDFDGTAKALDRAREDVMRQAKAYPLRV